KKQSEWIQQTLKEKQHELSTSEAQAVDPVSTQEIDDSELTNDDINVTTNETNAKDEVKFLYKLNFKELLFMALTSGAIG
ncbi:hypothetical protein WL359_12580, partial [Staphylococcus epidermidis]